VTLRITVLAGGVGGARFTRGLRDRLREQDRAAEITVVVNTGDDLWLDGLRVCPDLDTVMYTLGGVIGPDGWGRTGDTTRVTAELNAYGLGWDWFTLGDLDLGTHIARTELLRSGLSLTEVTARLCERWEPGVRLLPMSDQAVETHVELADDAGTVVHFEEWWVRLRASVPARRFLQHDVEAARPGPDVLAAIAGADLIVLPPSNPVVSIGTILGVPGIRDAVLASAAPVVGVSPIIAGAPVRGMADACLSAIGVATTALAVAQHYGSRRDGGLLDGWLVDTADAAALDRLTDLGIEGRALPLLMSDPARSAAIVDSTLALGERGRSPQPSH
jgi:LPPG:FO 2-phospho-L-lactate transferase